MKTKFKVILLTFLLGLVTLPQANANQTGDQIVQVVENYSTDYELEITDETFIANVFGYACPLPGIQLDSSMVSLNKLKHNGFPKEGASGLKNPNHEFCRDGHMPTLESLFEDQANLFVIGSKLPIKYKKVIRIIKRDEKQTTGLRNVKYLQEVVSFKMLNREFEDIAEIRLLKE